MASKDPGIRAIELEANRLSLLDGKSSFKERFALRTQLRAQSGLPPERVKRGGLGAIRLPPIAGDILRIGAQAAGTLVGIPPQVTGAVVNNLGRGRIRSFGDVVKRSIGGAISGAATGGALKGLAGSAGKGLASRAVSIGSGAIRGATNPLEGVGKIPGAAGVQRVLAKVPGLTAVRRVLGGPSAPAAMPASGGASGPWWQNPTMTDAVVAGAGGGAAAGGGNWWDTVKDVAGRVVGGVTGGRGSGGLLDAGLLGLAGAQAVNAANASRRSRGLSDDAINLAKENWAAGEDLRTAGRTGLLTPVRRDLGTTYADPTNPFAARASAQPPAPGAPTPVGGAPRAPIPIPTDSLPPLDEPTRLAKRRVPLTAAPLPASSGTARATRRAY